MSVSGSPRFYCGVLQAFHRGPELDINLRRDVACAPCTTWENKNLITYLRSVLSINRLSGDFLALRPYRCESDCLVRTTHANVLR